MNIFTKKQATVDRPQKPKTIVILSPQPPVDEVEAKIQELFVEKKAITEKIQTRVELAEEYAHEHDELHAKVEEQQKLLDQLYGERNDGYEEFNNKKSELFTAIGEFKQQEELCRMLEQQHLAKAKEAEDTPSREIYFRGAKFYRELRWEYNNQSREAIQEKRNLSQPSSDAIIDARNRLNELKRERAASAKKRKDLLDEINDLKKQGKDLYGKIGGLKALQLPRTSVNEEFLHQLNIPAKFWPTAKVVESQNGYINVYFGELDDKFDWHGHIVINKEGEVVYRREPQSIPQVVC